MRGKWKRFYYSCISHHGTTSIGDANANAWYTMPWEHSFSGPFSGLVRWHMAVRTSHLNHSHLFVPLIVIWAVLYLRQRAVSGCRGTFFFRNSGVIDVPDPKTIFISQHTTVHHTVFVYEIDHKYHDSAVPVTASTT